VAEEQVVSWRAIVAKCPVVAGDGKEIGTVLEVAALPKEDIFHGVVFQHHALGRSYMAPADSVDRITERAVYLNLDSAGAEKLEEFQQLHVERLGLKGLFFWKHTGWTDSSE
jgi:hypothetical protein